MGNLVLEAGDFDPQRGQLVAGFVSLRPEVLNFVDQKLLLGQQRLDVRIDRGGVIAPEHA